MFGKNILQINTDLCTIKKNTNGLLVLYHMLFPTANALIENTNWNVTVACCMFEGRPIQQVSPRILS